MPPTRHVFYTLVIKNEPEEHQEHPNQMKSERKKRGDCVHSNPFRVSTTQCPATITSFRARNPLGKPFTAGSNHPQRENALMKSIVLRTSVATLLTNF